MSLISELSANNDVAMAVASALEQALGNDVILAVGVPQTTAPDAGALLAGDIVAATTPVAGGASGGVHIVVTAALADAMQQHATDGTLAATLAAVLERATAAMTVVGSEGLEFGAPAMVPTADLLAAPRADHEFLVYPLLQGDEPVATFIVEIGPALAAAPDDTSVAPADPPVPVPSPDAITAPAPHVDVHDFPTLQEGGLSLVDPRPLSLLHDVEMGVTAELGRRRMTVRDLLSITPGAVIELDRAAGSPVDVLVNGTLIARGEVVVIDEEFGIRISEIVAHGDAA